MFVILVMKDSIYLYNEEENKLLSRTISFIRFPLCVLVVILHSDLLAKPIYRLGILDISKMHQFIQVYPGFFLAI